MTDKLIEQVARVIIGPREPLPEGSQYSLEALRATRWYNAENAMRQDALWAARAILPIIKAERIRGGEMVKEAAADRCAKHMMDCLDDKDIQKRWPNIKRDNDWYASMVRALSVPAIVEAGDGDL